MQDGLPALLKANLEQLGIVNYFKKEWSISEVFNFRGLLRGWGAMTHKTGPKFMCLQWF